MTLSLYENCCTARAICQQYLFVAQQEKFACKGQFVNAVSSIVPCGCKFLLNLKDIRITAAPKQEEIQSLCRTRKNG